MGKKADDNDKDNGDVNDRTLALLPLAVVGTLVAGALRPYLRLYLCLGGERCTRTDRPPLPKPDQVFCPAASHADRRDASRPDARRDRNQTNRPRVEGEENIKRDRLHNGLHNGGLRVTNLKVSVPPCLQNDCPNMGAPYARGKAGLATQRRTGLRITLSAFIVAVFSLSVNAQLNTASSDEDLNAHTNKFRQRDASNTIDDGAASSSGWRQCVSKFGYLPPSHWACPDRPLSLSLSLSLSRARSPLFSPDVLPTSRT